MAKLTTAQRIVIGFAIAPLALMGMAFYALHDLATLKEQAAVIVTRSVPRPLGGEPDDAARFLSQIAD